MRSLLYFLAALFVIYLIDWSFLTGTIRGYEIVCYQDIIACRIIASSVYKVNVENQTVVQKSEYRGAVSYKNCSVFSRKNWECTHESGAVLGFINGDHFYTSGSQETWDRIATYKQVSRLEYIYTGLAWWFK